MHSVRRALLVAFIVTLAIAATGAASALAAPGAITGLTSSSSSSQSFSFTWNPMRGIAGYAYTFDQSPGTAAGSSVALSTLSLSTGSSLTVGSAPRQVVTGDFGNGQLDLAVINATSNTVRVVMGNGKGAFTVGSSYATGVRPQSIAAGDFNGDGRPDLAVANWTGNTLSVLLANGVGTFAPKVDYPTGKNPHGIAVGDLGNGKLDVVVPDATGNVVSVLIGNGDGTFAPKVDYPTGQHPEKVAIADYNADGKPDLALINNAGNTVSMFVGNGDGTFSAGSTFATGKTPYWVAAGDLDGDGNLDLAVANYAANTISVLLGRGNATFAAKVDYPVGVNPICVAIVDFNGDGGRDLVVSDHAGDIAVLLGKGNGSFQPARFTATDANPRFFAVADFDGDGQPDLAVPFDTLGRVRILLNKTGSVAPSVTQTTNVGGAWYFHVAAVDVNGVAGPTATLQVGNVADTTPPTTSDDIPSGGVAYGVGVQLTPTDTGSGMTGGSAGTWYSVDGAAYVTGTSVPVLPAGTHTLTYYSSDAAGNVETPHTSTVTVSQALLTVNAVDASKLSGQSDPPLQYNLTGFVNGEDAASAGVSGSPAISRAAGESIGTYPVTVLDTGDLSAADYSFAIGTGATFTINGGFAVTAPSDGQVVVRNVPTQITWHLDAPVSSGVFGVVAVDQAGTKFTLSSAVAAVDGQRDYGFAWKPTVAAGSYKIHVLYGPTSGDWRVDNSSAGSFSVVAPTILISSPAGGESWQAGTYQTVSWTITYPLSFGQIAVCIVDGAGKWTTLTSFTPTGQTTYSVPVKLPVSALGSGYKIAVEWRADPAVSTWQIQVKSNPITVIAAQKIVISSPAGGESWQAGTIRTVSWTVTYPLSSGEFRISAVSSAGTFTTLSSLTPTVDQTAYSQPVTLPASLAAGTGYKIAVYWRADPTVSTWQLQTTSNAITVTK